MFSDVIIRGSDDDWSFKNRRRRPGRAFWVEGATAEHESLRASPHQPVAESKFSAACLFYLFLPGIPFLVIRTRL